MLSFWFICLFIKRRGLVLEVLGWTYLGGSKFGVGLYLKRLILEKLRYYFEGQGHPGETLVEENVDSK